MLARITHSSARFAITLGFALTLLSSSFSQASDYPHSKGPVSDYAGKLSQQQVQELTSLVQEYERQTSIEIAVVVATVFKDKGQESLRLESVIRGE